MTRITKEKSSSLRYFKITLPFLMNQRAEHNCELPTANRQLTTNGTLVVLLLLLCGFFAQAHAELTDAEKRAAFLKSQSSATASTSPHKKKHHSNSSSSSSSKKHHSASSTTTQHHRKHSSTSTHHAVAPSSDTSHDVIIPINPSTKNATAPITIEKSGILKDQGLQPMPTPLPHTTHGWWIFSHDETSGYSYSYLTPAIRRAIDRAHVRRGRWKYIVVHNSGSRVGNARIFDVYHRRVRHMVNGLAYHFVIGNGHGSGNGQIEVGHRWTAQLNGGHVASDYLNDIALGICLVGDYNRDVPNKAQIIALNELITYLRYRVGRVQGKESIVKAHKEINPRPTDCPGRYFPYGWMHREFDK